MRCIAYRLQANLEECHSMCVTVNHAHFCGDSVHHKRCPNGSFVRRKNRRAHCCSPLLAPLPQITEADLRVQSAPDNMDEVLLLNGQLRGHYVETAGPKRIVRYCIIPSVNGKEDTYTIGYIVMQSSLTDSVAGAFATNLRRHRYKRFHNTIGINDHLLEQRITAIGRWF